MKIECLALSEMEIDCVYFDVRGSLRPYVPSLFIKKAPPTTVIKNIKVDRWTTYFYTMLKYNLRNIMKDTSSFLIDSRKQ